MNSKVTEVTARVLVLFVIAFVLAIVTQLCWNSSIAPLTGAKPATFWQAFGINILGSIVFQCKTSKDS